MKLNIDISKKGFTVNRVPGQELSSIATFMPRTSYDYASQVNGRQSSIVMACVGWAQCTFPEATIMLEKLDKDGEWERVYGHPFLKIMEQPNNYYSGLLMSMSLISDWMIDGNVYYRKVRSGAKRVVELLYIPSTMIEPKWPYSGNEYISYYEYYSGTSVEQIPVEDIVHFRNGLDTDNTRKGCSKLKSLFREIFTDDEAANMTAALLKNLGVPGLVISPGKGMSASTDEAKETKEWFKKNFTGAKRGDPLVMKGDTQVQQFGFTPQQMDLKALRRIPEERISGVFGIAAIVAGLGAGLDRSTFANFAEAREAAYESFIIPTQRLTADVLKHQLLNEYEDDLDQWRVGYDLSDVRILQEDENAKITRINQMVAGGYLMVADAQRMAGAPVDENANYYLRPFTAQAIYPDQVGTEEEEETEEPVSKEQKSFKSKLSEEQKELDWKAYAANAEGFEKQFIPKIKSMFAAQEKEVLKAVRSGATSNLFNKDKAKKQYVNVAKPVLSSVLKWAITDAQEIMPQKSLKSSTAYEAALKWLGTRLTWAAEAISEETATSLNKALSAGWEAGEGADELAKRVKAVFDVSNMRAERIARTETMQASAQGAVEGYKELAVPQVEFFAAMDERLCEDCNALHGEKFAIDEAEGVITVHPNCRCKFLPVVE